MGGDHFPGRERKGWGLACKIPVSALVESSMFACRVAVGRMLAAGRMDKLLHAVNLAAAGRTTVVVVDDAAAAIVADDQGENLSILALEMFQTEVLAPAKR